MEKNTVLIVALLTLIIGGGVGYALGFGQNAIPMNNREIGMGNAMSDMMVGLAGKTGNEFDKAFLSEMIMHHQGAVQMAEAALQYAEHDEIKQMAKAIISAQTSEITQMKEWQKRWYEN